MSELRRSSLSERKRALLALLQQINFGRIEGLVVRGGEPVLEPPPRVLSTFKFGGETIPMIRVVVTDRNQVRPAEVGLHLLREVYVRHPGELVVLLCAKPALDLLAKHELQRG